MDVVIFRNLLRPSIGLVLCLCTASAANAQNPPEQPGVVIKNAVRLVEVDVIAKDKRGNPVADLQAKDFKLFDNGQPQEVTRVSVERHTGAVLADSPPADVKHVPARMFSNTHTIPGATTVILLDVLNTAAENQPSMKRELLKSLNHMKEGTRVALLILGDDLTVVSDFTDSTISLKNAAQDQFHARTEGFGPPITARATGNPVRDRMILKAATQAFRTEDTERAVRTIAALDLICSQLARIPGRKSLVWITGGLTAAGQNRDVSAEIDRLNDANIAVYTVDARGVVLDPGTGADSDSNDMTASMAEGREDTRGEVLATVATSTGGVFYHNTNRLEGAIDQALSDAAVIYVIDYYPRHNKWDGKLHQLQVKTSRPGVRLRFRESYRATLAPQNSPQDPQQMLAAVATASLDSPGLLFSVEVKSKSGSDPILLLHVPVEELQWSTEEGKKLGSLQVWFLQKRASGDDLFTMTWKSDPRLSNDQYQQAARAGLSLSGELKLQPSVAKIRVVLRDVNSGKIGSVDVPAESITAVSASR